MEALIASHSSRALPKRDMDSLGYMSMTTKIAKFNICKQVIFWHDAVLSYFRILSLQASRCCCLFQDISHLQFSQVFKKVSSSYLKNIGCFSSMAEFRPAQIKSRPIALIAVRSFKINLASSVAPRLSCRLLHSYVRVESDARRHQPYQPP